MNAWILLLMMAVTMIMAMMSFSDDEIVPGLILTLASVLIGGLVLLEA